MTEKYSTLLTWAKADLEGNLMKWWAENTVDEKHGGFYGAINADNTPDETADKFIVLNARLVWTYSACYDATKNEKYKKLAQRAYEYVATHFYDKKYGGFYTWVNYRGEPVAEHKFTYGNAFAIYGLVEYARVFNCNEAKMMAQETAKLLDANMWDIQYGGYYEMASREWQYTPNVNLLTADTRVQKTMNTHLHMVEAYTNLLRIDNSKALRSKVRELLYLILNKIVNRDNWHFYLFQTRDWAPTTPDLTLGHDIEGSWLLYETAEALGESEALADTRKVAVNMARAAYDDGIAESGAMHTEYHLHERRFSANFSWWEQCEAVVGFLNAWQLTKEDKFLDAALAALEYVDKHFIDRTLGGWYAWVNNDGTPMSRLSKADGYTCPYHNARMSIEVMRRLQ
ncbi:MAG: AGE family epimerase/isomerase [Defluviitaleaceae bacterium]|nr:AGE family epimerase/isomerase [Defluviitaleaceae bacterium]